MMRFSKTDNIYKIIRITGSQDNILGISFGEDDVEVIEWNFNNSDRSRIRTSKEEVLEQVLFGLESVNKSLGTNYKLSKIYFSPFDISTNRIYSGLIAALIRHYHNGHEFKEI
nr:hypothetical protein [Naviculales sp.]